MSRTTHKYLKLFPTCTKPQTNTQWYRKRRKQYRAKNKDLLRRLSQYNDIDDHIFNKKPRTKFDENNEPSDGRIIYYYRYFKTKYKDERSKYHRIKRNNKWQRKIKPKIRK